MGIFHYSLGVQVSYTKHGLCLYEKRHILDLLGSIGLEDTKSISVPMVAGKHLRKYYSVSLMNPVDYRRVVGSLQYPTLTQPDIAFRVNRLC